MKKKLYDKLSFIVFGIVLLMLLSFLTLNQYLSSRQIQSFVMDEAKNVIANQKSYLENFVQKMEKQLQVFHQNRFYKKYMTDRKKSDLESLFYAIIHNDATIMQIRFLDHSGQEKIRVERNELHKKPFKTPENKLQNKKNRNYFRIAHMSQSNQIIYSDLDLNMEHGVVETPYKPTLRAMLPVFENKNFQGVFIINYFMQPLLDELNHRLFYETVIYDKDGFTLLHHDPAKSWSRYTTPSTKLDNPHTIDDKLTLIDNTHMYTRINIHPFNFIINLNFKQSYINTFKNGIQTRNNALFIAFVLLLTLIFLLIIKQIQQFKENYTKMAHAHELFHETFDNAPIGIAHVGLDGSWLRVNRTLCNFLGYPEKTLLKLTFQEITYAEDLTADLDNVQRLLDGQIKTYQMEKRYFHQDGTIIWAELTVALSKDKQGKPDYFISMINDIGSRKKLEAEQVKLLEREQSQNRQLSQYLDLIDHYVITSSTDLNGRITDASTAFCEISGYSKEELLGKSHSIVRHEDMPHEIYTQLWDTIKQNSVWEGELKNKSKSGNYYWVKATITPRYDETGKKVGYTAVRHLITAQKDLETSQDIIVSQSRLSAMGEILSMLSHQWRQPLNLINMGLGKLRLFMELKKSKQEIDETIKGLESSVIGLSEMINEFRNYFDPQNDSHQVPLKEVLKIIRSVHQDLLNQHHIELKHSFKSSDEDILLPQLMTQVFITITTNCIESLIQKKRSEKFIDINVSADPNELLIIITDNGIGIDKKNAHKVFEPYFSTKKELNGKGMGLYIAKTIIESKLQGTITLQNIQEGVEVKITIPRP